MNNKFEETLGKIKSQLKSFIKTDMDSKQLDEITAIDKSLDELNDSHQEVVKESDDLKDRLIDSIKNTGFKSSSNESNDIGLSETKTLEQIMAEELEKITAK